MTTAEAREMLADAPFRNSGPAVWCDLGCGSGVFTRALADLLPAGSTIHAWDVDASALRTIPSEHVGVRIVARATDFTQGELPSWLSGILIANALHYVADPLPFLRKAVAALAPDGLFLVAEYDIVRPVERWVPYPINPVRMETLLADAGFPNHRVLAKRPSIYQRGALYTAAAWR